MYSRRINMNHIHVIPFITSNACYECFDTRFFVRDFIMFSQCTRNEIDDGKS